MLTLGSLFDGIGGWLDASVRAGVKPIWASEIEPFPCAVTAHHYPDVKQMGDITKIDIDKLEPVDIICAGSPCQDLSVAGKREGLAGERSGLFRTAINIVHRLRDRTGLPRYFVWENVCGAFTTGKDENGNNCRGADFRAVLQEIGQTEIPLPENGKWANAGLVELPKCQIAWRVLDAQHWGVPQRRRRIFLVADFAESRRSAGKILFIESGLPWDSEESREAGEGTSTGTGTGVETASNGLMSTRGGQSYCTESNVAYSMSHDIRSLKRRDYKEPIAVCASSFGGYSKSDVAGNIRSSGGDIGGGSEALILNNKKLNRDAWELGGNVPMIQENRSVRRLTPVEAERLQGWEDNYTNVPFNGKPATDSARYKALGNGMAQPCARWIIQRIVEVNANE